MANSYDIGDRVRVALAFTDDATPPQKIRPTRRRCAGASATPRAW